MLSLQPQRHKMNQPLKQIFNFIEIPMCKTNESTPVLTNEIESQISNYFTKTIEPKCALVKEMYEASKLARELGIISPQLIQKRAIEISTQKFKKVIVLDLDETLVHTQKHVSSMRPHCQEFLWKLSQIAVVVLFTASKNEHALKMVKLIDPKRKIFQKICTSDQCIGFIKNLNIFNVDLKDILIVDNSPKNFIAQLDNGVPITPYLGDEDDHELVELLEFLQECIKYEDVRIPIADKFKIAQFHKEISGRHAVHNLYQNSIK